IKQEVNVPMEVWLDELKSVDEDIMFLSPHMDVFQEMIESQSNTYFHIPVQISHIPSPKNMFMLMDEATTVHTVAPNYLRITEAEANLLKQKKEVSNEG